MEKKATVGQIIFQEVFQRRLSLITSTDIDGSFAAIYRPNDEESYQIEHNFFKLMHILTKNSLPNANHVKDIKRQLTTYMEEHTSGRRDIQEKIAKIVQDAVFWEDLDWPSAKICHNQIQSQSSKK